MYVLAIDLTTYKILIVSGFKTESAIRAKVDYRHAYSYTDSTQLQMVER